MALGGLHLLFRIGTEAFHYAERPDIFGNELNLAVRTPLRPLSLLRGARTSILCAGANA